MSRPEIEQIWHNDQRAVEGGNWLSVEELRAFRKNYSKKIARSNRGILLLDSIYKMIVIVAYILLLLIGKITMLKAGMTGLVVSGLSLLLFKNKLLLRSIDELDRSKDVIHVLKAQYGFLNRFYREFLFIGPVTNPFFVLAGFQFYHFFSSGQDRLPELLSDPVTYIFLVLAFVIPFIAQKITYTKELNELEQFIAIELADAVDEVSLIGLQARKRARQVLYLLLILTGSFLLFVLLNR